ncbi:G5 domain-containing protein [Arthrobacter sp. UM1]|uniref:G5 domain-containing protein n=1 Tax=Arthrobacter sp. UM1 TaxID=2766776 RepID=UPI001CF6A9D9|nr:G5 domain-containing protein [Arthrobacter sp. UM1]MCB4207979.1 G5 domain-containing protein [Arthrobacter sp. UM1]
MSHRTAAGRGRPAWANRRLLPQSAVIVGLVASTIAYIPVGKPAVSALGGSGAVVAEARSVSVIVNGETRTVKTRAQTVGGLLDELGYSGHAVPSVPEETRLDRLSSPLSIDLAREVTIVSGGNSFQVFTRVATVRELLQKTGLELNTQLSESKGVFETTAVYDGMTVYVKKLDLPLSVKEDEQIPFASEQFVDPSMAPGTRRVIRPGKVGQRVRIYRVEASKNGSLNRVLVSTSTVKKPVAEQIAIGVNGGGIEAAGSHPTLSDYPGSRPQQSQGSENSSSSSPSWSWSLPSGPQSDKPGSGATGNPNSPWTWGQYPGRPNTSYPTVTPPPSPSRPPWRPTTPPTGGGGGGGGGGGPAGPSTKPPASTPPATKPPATKPPATSPPASTRPPATPTPPSSTGGGGAPSPTPSVPAQGSFWNPGTAPSSPPASP